MIVMTAVLETGALRDFALWPVAERDPYPFMPLNGAMSPELIGTAVATIADYNASTDDSGPAGSATAFLRPLLHEDGFIAPGGLLVRDPVTGATLSPGCCCGLEDWREWLELAAGGGMWLGHDPTPWSEHIGDTVRLHPGGERPGPVIEFARARLPRLLAGVQQDLADFLLLVTAWAEQHAPESAQPLASAFDRSLQICAPLRQADRAPRGGCGGELALPEPSLKRGSGPLQPR